MSECQPLPAYETQAIYFVQIRVRSHFTHCLCFFFWSFISFTYTRSLFVFCLMLLFVPWRRYKQVHACRGCHGLGENTFEHLLVLLFWRLFCDTVLCSKVGSTVSPTDWIYTLHDFLHRFHCQNQSCLAMDVVMWGSLVVLKRAFRRMSRGAQSDKRQLADRQQSHSFKRDTTLNHTIQTGAVQSTQRCQMSGGGAVRCSALAVKLQSVF